MTNNKQLFSIALSVITLIGTIEYLPIKYSYAQSSNQTPNNNSNTELDLEKQFKLFQELYQQGKYREAIPVMEEILAYLEKTLGPEDPQVASSLNNLAQTYNNQGDYKKAIPLFQRAIKIREKILGPDHPNLGNSLNNLGQVYYNQGNYKPALELLQRSLAIWEKAYGPDHPSVATSLNNIASLYKNQSNYSQALPLLQRSLSIYEKAYGTDHPTVANNLNNLAELYREQGNYPQALTLYQRSLATYEKIYKTDHPSVARTLSNLAGLYRDQSNYKTALPLYQRALTIYEKTLGSNHPELANSLNNLAGLFRISGNYNQALKLYNRTLAIQEQALGKKHPDYATTLNNLATLYQEQGNYIQSFKLNQQSLEIYETIYGPEHPSVASSLIGLAILYQDQGNHDQALSLYQRSLEIYQKKYGSDHPNLSTSLNGIASSYQNQKKYNEALALYQRSLTITEKALGKNTPDYATSLNNLALLYLNQEKYDQALPLYQESLGIYQQILGSDHPYVATNLRGIAFLYQNQGKYPQALELYQKSLAIYQKAYGSDHPNIAQTLNGLSLLYIMQNKIPEALQYLNQSLQIEETNIQKILPSGSESKKRDYMKSIIGSTSATISLNLRFAPNNPKATNLALTTILQRKGRILDALSDNQQILRQRLTPANQQLLDQLVQIRTEISNLALNQNKISIEKYRTQITELEKQEEELSTTLNNNALEFKIQSQPITLQSIQKKIPSDSVLVEFVLYKSFNLTGKLLDNLESRYAVYILHPNQEPIGIDLGPATTINKSIEEFRIALTSPSRRSRIAIAKQKGRQLDELIMKPIRPFLQNKTQILLSPDGDLNLIPYAALVDQQNKFLVENHTITYLSSGRDLLRLDTPSIASNPPLLVGNPAYDEMPTIQIASIVNPNTATRSTNWESIEKFSPLPNAETEAKEISSLLPTAKLVTNFNATKTLIKTTPNPIILHLATHGFFLPNLNDENSKENPLLRAGLAFAGANNARQNSNDDGILTALEVTNMDLRGTELLVLSACQTALGDISNGEGVYGLRRAFAIAGVKSQVSTLWRVDDLATKELMLIYYQNLKNKIGRSQALRLAQLQLLKTKELPYYWAAFVPTGDWRPIPKEVFGNQLLP